MRIKNLNHSTYQHQYHIVWGTRWRRKWLKEYVKKELLRSVYRVIKRNPELWIETINNGDDHIHMQIEIPPSVAICDVVRELKKESSKHLKKKFKFIRGMYIDGKIWSVGYFSSTIGLNEAQIKKYIEHQDKQERPGDVSFLFS
jgi:putative transposase